MKRVGRGGSPEVLVGPCDYSSGFSAAGSSFRELDDVFLQTQTRIWLGEVLHVRFDEETSIADLLADGELLFQVSKVVWRMLLKKHAELKYSKVYIHERASFRKSGGRYMAYPKVDSFLRICQILGLTGIDLFSPSDVVEKRDTRRVCMCIRSLSKRARTKDLNVPDFDIVTYTIAMPTYMVGSIRRRLEQSWWSSTNSSGCTPCMDLKEIYRQRSLDSDYMWHHSSCSESDDAEDTYREYELQSPASTTSYDDADISSLIGENLPGSESVAEENIFPSQDFFTLTWEQDEDVFRSIPSVETYLDRSLVLPHSKTSPNGNVQVTAGCCCKSSLPCRTCHAHVDVKTSLSFMEDITWLSSSTNSSTEFHKFGFSHSPANTLLSRNLASESDSCLMVDAKEEKSEAGTSMQDDRIAKKKLPKSYRNLDSVKEDFPVKEEFQELSVPPTSIKQMISITESQDTDTCMLLINEDAKESDGHVIECNNGLSEFSSAGLLGSLCESRHAEVNPMDNEGLNAGIYVNNNLVFMSSDALSDNPDPIILDIKNQHYNSSEAVADDQSPSHIEALNVNLRPLMCKVGDAEDSLISSQNSRNTIKVICEDLSDTAGCLQFPDFPSSQKNSQIDLTDEGTLKGLPGSIDNEELSMSMLNEASLNGNGVACMSSKLCNMSDGTAYFNRDTIICHESQASATDRDSPTSGLQNPDLIDNKFIGSSCMLSVSKELGLSWVSAECSELNSECPPRNRHCRKFTDVIQAASDSSTCSEEQHNYVLSHNGDAMSDVEDKTLDFCARLHGQSLSPGSLTRVNDSPKARDLMLEKVVEENPTSYGSVFEDIKPITVNNYCMNEVERQSGADCRSKDSALDEDTKMHQIAVVDGEDCSQTIEKKMVNNLEGFRKQTAGGQQTITEREGKSLVIEPGKTDCPCCRISDETVHIKQGSLNGVSCCVKDKMQQGIDCKISEVPVEKCLTYNGTVPKSVYAEESSVLILQHLGKDSEELHQEKIQKVDSDVSVSASLPVADFSERQMSHDTWHNHLDQAEACTLKIGDQEMSLASDEDCLCTGYLDTNTGSIHLDTCSHICSSDSHYTAHCNSVSGTGYPLGNSCVHSKGCPCSTACVLDMKNSANQSIEMRNYQPFKDEGSNSTHHDDFACARTLEKAVEDDVRKTQASTDDRKAEAAGLETKPSKKVMLKSFAGGVTIVGALFLLLHFRRREERGSVATNVVKLQTEKASRERRPNKDKSRRLYPAEKFKF